MPSSADRPQPEQSLQAQSPWIDKLAIATSRRGFLQAAGALIGATVASRLGIAKAQTGGELYQGTQPPDPINPCGPKTETRSATKVLELCFDDRLNEDGSIKTPEQQGVYRRFLRADHPEDRDDATPFFRRICADGSVAGDQNPFICVDPVTQVEVPDGGMTMANLREERFTSSLAVPAEQTLPEPVAQPEFDPYSLPLGAFNQVPNIGKPWLGNPDSCLDDVVHYNRDAVKCNIPERVLPASRGFRLTYDRKNNMPADAKQGPGDLISLKTFKVLGRENRPQTGYNEIRVSRFSEGSGFWLWNNGLQAGVYEMELVVNGDPQVVYRLQVK